MRMIISWFNDVSLILISDNEDGPYSLLSSAYRTVDTESMDEQDLDGTPRVRTGASKSSMADGSRTSKEVPRKALVDAAGSLLVAIHSCLSTEDWTDLLPHVWRLVAEPGIDTQAVSSFGAQRARLMICHQMAFLIMKCAGPLPAQLQQVIMTDITRWVRRKTSADFKL